MNKLSPVAMLLVGFAVAALNLFWGVIVGATVWWVIWVTIVTIILALIGSFLLYIVTEVEDVASLFTISDGEARWLIFGAYLLFVLTMIAHCSHLATLPQYWGTYVFYAILVIEAGVVVVFLFDKDNTADTVANDEQEC